MGNACCSGRFTSINLPRDELPSNLDLKSLQKLQGEVQFQLNEISRDKETLLYMSDEVAAVEQRLSALSSQLSSLQVHVFSVHEHASVLITAKSLRNTVSANLHNPGFNVVVRKLGREMTVRKLTAMRKSECDGVNSVMTRLAEVMEQKEWERTIDARIAEVALAAKTYSPQLSDLLLQLCSLQSKLSDLSHRFRIPLLCSIQRRLKVLQDLKATHQANLLRCVLHETALTAVQKTLHPGQTLDQFQTAERQCIDNEQECVHKLQLIELLETDVVLRIKETTTAKNQAEEISARGGSIYGSPNQSEVTTAESMTDDNTDTLSYLDLSEFKATSRSFAIETRDQYAGKIISLRKSISDFSSKTRQKEFGIQVLQDRVAESEELLVRQRVKTVYFVLLHAMGFMTLRGLRTWRLKAVEATQSMQVRSMRQAALQRLAAVLTSHIRSVLPSFIRSSV